MQFVIRDDPKVAIQRESDILSRYPPSMSDLRIVFIGDVVGKPGRRVLEQRLPDIRRDHDPHLVIVNAENARSGSGLTPDIYRKIRAAGVDAVTLGDHAYRDARIIELLQTPKEPVLRPANLALTAPGKRKILIEPPTGFDRPILIITVLGRIFFPLPANDPFQCVDEILTDAAANRPIVIVEAHMEATSEKIALASHVDGRASAVLGTHTHVPTADARVLRGGTAFITDVGMTGPYDSIIGRETDAVLKHMRTAQHVRYGVAEGGAKVCGAAITVDSGTGRARSIERLEYAADYEKPPFK